MMMMLLMLLLTIKRFLPCCPWPCCCCSIAFQAAKAHTKERGVCVCVCVGCTLLSACPCSLFPLWAVMLGFCSKTQTNYPERQCRSLLPSCLLFLLFVFAIHSQTHTQTQDMYTGRLAETDRRFIFLSMDLGNCIKIARFSHTFFAHSLATPSPENS